MNPLLIVNPASADEQIFELKQGANTVGRTRDNDVSLANKSLSRAHARIDVTASGVVLVDLGSKNGTWVDGVRVATHTLGRAHTITFGEVAASYERAPRVTRVKAPLMPTCIKRFDDDLSRVSLAELIGPKHARATGRKPREASADRDRDKLRILLKVSQLLSTPAPLAALLASVLDLAFELLDIDRAVLLMLDPETGELEPRTLKTRAVSGDKAGLFSMSIARYVMEHGDAALFNDAATDPRLAQAGSVNLQSIRTSMCSPLKARDRTLGVLYVDNLRDGGRFGEEDLEFLSAFACQAAIAVENALLADQLAAEAVSRAQLLRFFPPAVLPAILKAGGGLAAVEVEATVLFCDLCGYTEMSSRMKPTDVIELLNRYFPAVAEVVFRHEGTLEKYIGDALLAVWGAPLHHDDDAVRAVQAAIDMQRAVRTLNAEWRGEREVSIHIGVYSGVVAAGNIGSKDFLQYATIGDATNMGSRICGLAEPGQIVLGGSKVSLVRQAGVRLTALEPALVKGKDVPLEVHRVEWD